MQLEKISFDIFEIKNGIVGANRDVIFELIKLIYFRKDNIIRNIIGMCGECANWINHPHFLYSRNPKTNLNKQILPTHSVKYIVTTPTDIMFTCRNYLDEGTLFLNIIIKEMIFECAFKIKRSQCDRNSCIFIGVSTPSQLKEAMSRGLGRVKNTGACFNSYFDGLYFRCNGNSCFLSEGGIKDGEVVTTVINQMNNNSSLCRGKMNFFRNGKKVLRAITNIPFEGAYLGFSHFLCLLTLHVISLRKILIPTACVDDGAMRCVAYDFCAENCCGRLKDEEGKLISMPYYETY